VFNFSEPKAKLPDELSWIAPNVRVEIFWKADNKWYPATVLRYSESTPGYCWIKYNDGKKHLEKPKSTKWRQLSKK